jgi:hypothetical protein
MRSPSSRSLSFAVLLLLAGPARAGDPKAPAAKVKPNEVAEALAKGLTLDADDPATCAPCHAAVVSEWKESLHSRSHHASDPLYGTMRALRLEKQGAHIPGQCANCHNPRDTADHESRAAKGGVTCATCHQLDAVTLAEGKKGVANFTLAAARTFRGPHEVPNGTAPLHATGAALAALSDGKTLCLACHMDEKNAAGVATCTTGVEHAEGSEHKSCAECHMPLEQSPAGAVSVQRPTHRSHRFPGPHQAQRKGEEGLLAQAVALSGRFEGGKLLVKLVNKSGHAFPTGFPARTVVLDVRALDASGKEVFKNITADPMKEHPEGVLNKGYVDAEGKPALAAFAARLVRDTRLKPNEAREISLSVPASAVKAELALRFFLAPAQMMKTINYQGPEGKPVSMGRVTVAR